jgi:cob(I)alamin adenosyltransferase
LKHSGLVHIIAGDGKGKTTSALGSAMRAYGAGFRVIVFQFLKGQNTSELSSLKELGIKYVRTDEVKKFVLNMTEAEMDECIKSHEKCFALAKESVLSGEYDMVILDEILDAINLKLIDEQQVFDLIAHKPIHCEFILTGRNPSEKLCEKADYFSEITNKKHPFEKGVTARLGIEY